MKKNEMIIINYQDVITKYKKLPKQIVESDRLLLPNCFLFSLLELNYRKECNFVFQIKTRAF